MMVASSLGAVPISLPRHSPPEFAPPHHQCFFEQATLFQIADQRGTGLIGISTPRQAPRTQPAVMVPVGMEQLHKPHAALDQPAGQQAVRRVGARPPRIGPIHLERRLALARQVGQLGNAGLHPPRQFVLGHAIESLGVPGLLLSLGVEFRQVVQHAPSQVAREPRRVAQVQHAVAGIPQLHSLVPGRQKPRAPVMVVEGLVAPPLEPGDEHKVIGQVGVLASQAIAGPCPKAGAAGQLVPGEQAGHGRGVVDLVGEHRFDEAEFVGDLAMKGEPLPDGRPT